MKKYLKWKLIFTHDSCTNELNSIVDLHARGILGHFDVEGGQRQPEQQRQRREEQQQQTHPSVLWNQLN